MSPKFDKDGYKHYILSRDGKPTHVRGHRVVAENFIVNLCNLPMVNHIAKAYGCAISYVSRLVNRKKRISVYDKFMENYREV